MLFKAVAAAVAALVTTGVLAAPHNKPPTTTTTAPLAVVDANGQIVGRLAPGLNGRPVIYGVFNGQLSGMTVSGSGGIDSVYSLEVIPLSIPSVYFTSQNCSGPAYLESMFSDDVGIGPTTVASGSTQTTFTAYSVPKGQAPVQITALSALQAGTYCSPFSGSFTAYPAVQSNLNTTYPFPWHLQ